MCDMRAFVRSSVIREVFGSCRNLAVHKQTNTATKVDMGSAAQKRLNFGFEFSLCIELTDFQIYLAKATNFDVIDTLLSTNFSHSQ